MPGITLESHDLVQLLGGRTVHLTGPLEGSWQNMRSVNTQLIFAMAATFLVGAVCGWWCCVRCVRLSIRYMHEDGELVVTRREKP